MACRLSLFTIVLCVAVHTIQCVPVDQNIPEPRNTLADLLKRLEADKYNSVSAKPISLADLEREATTTDNGNKSPDEQFEQPRQHGRNKSETSIEDQIRMISLNNPEYRVMGPNKTEVHMSDDVGSRIMVALLNMQEEAGDLLKQVSSTVESGFNEFKGSAQKVAKSIEDMLLQTSSKPVVQGGKPEVQYGLFTPEGYPIKPEGLHMDEPASLFDDAAKAGDSQSGIKKFLDNVGLTSENQKKAEDALSQAGTATSDAFNKAASATGDALSKAGTAIGTTITKDIPEQWNKIFG